MSADTHARFRRRLPSHAAGLLSESEEREFLEHRAQCEDCRRAFDEFTASDEAALTERGAHIPAAMLARWPLARRQLAGLERAMVREHLRHCDECRGDLERAGHAPELEHLPGYEATPRPLDWRARLFGRPPRSGAARMAEPSEGRAHGVPAAPGARRAADRPRRWAPWLLGGWATAATTAAVILAVIPPRIREPEEPPAPAVPPATAVPAPAPARGYTLEAVTAAARLKTPRRGPSESPTTIVTGEDTRYVQLTVGALDLPEGKALEAGVLVGDRVLMRRVLDRRGSEGVSLVFGRADRALVPGDYTLRLTAPPSAAGGAAPDTVEFAFRVVRRPR